MLWHTFNTDTFRCCLFVGLSTSGKPSGGPVMQIASQDLSWAMQDWELFEEPMGNLTQPHYCKNTFDAITMDGDGTVLVFRGGLFWTVTAEGKGSAPLPLKQRWPELPFSIEAAAFSPLDDKFYFFNGKHIWRYSGTVLDLGFPKKSSECDMPRHPDCAFFYAPLGHMVVFKGSRYYVLNLETLSSEPYYPRGLADWKGVPRGANGAVTRADGRLYFFREQQYWRFDPRKLRITASGQWTRKLTWTGCQSTPSNDAL